ncbi:MAG: PqqD family protein [Halomonas sp.]|nr:PqqD family protein [Halomonas sp.]
MTRPVLRRRHAAELLEDDQLALYDTRSGRYFRPNDTAAMIWLLATEGLDPDAIAEELVQAAAQAGTSPDVAALRRDVWATLGEWCREGLLCQRGEVEFTRQLESVPPAEIEAHPTERRLLQLNPNGLCWALEVGSPAAMARLSMLFGEQLAPLDNVAETKLPRLAVLVEAAGYALVAGSQVVRSRLTLTQLAPALLAYLVSQAARPGHPVVDAHLLVTPDGLGVLCLMPDDAESRDALLPLTSEGATLSRGVRLDLARLEQAEPLGLPLVGQAPAMLPDKVTIRGVLMSGDTQEAPASAGVLDILGVLLPCCVSATDEPLSPDAVTALGDWVARLDRLNIGTGDAVSTSEALVDWLARRVSSDVPVADRAMAQE